ncbi:MAG: cytochrome c [Candidatus Aquilonibacter sp.]|jgi:mono/diheme cytochrome c family protein
MARLAAVALIGILAACAKGNNSASESASPSSEPSVAASVSAAVAQNGAAANDGAKIYTQNCSSCHQASGQGLQGTFPPLAGNPTVTGDPAKVIHIVKYGLNGALTVAGANYNGMMPAWSQSLSNADIASAVTYIRSAWGNKASAVTESAVAAVSQ